MPIAVDRGGGIKVAGLGHGIGCLPIHGAPEIAGEGRRKEFPTAEREAATAEEASACTSTSLSSSIGKNSESFGTDGEDLEGEKEVESKYKGPLSALEALEEALPVRFDCFSIYIFSQFLLFFVKK